MLQRACHSTLTLGEQQRLLAELDRAADTGVQVRGGGGSDEEVRDTEQ